MKIILQTLWSILSRSSQPPLSCRSHTPLQCFSCPKSSPGRRPDNHRQSGVAQAAGIIHASWYQAVYPAFLAFPTETPGKAVSCAFSSLVLRPPDWIFLRGSAWCGVSSSLWNCQQEILLSLTLASLCQSVIVINGDLGAHYPVPLLDSPPASLASLLTVPQVNQAGSPLRAFVLLFHLPGILIPPLLTGSSNSSRSGHAHMSSQQGLP